MFEVKENQKVLPDGTQITTFTREVISTLGIEAEAGTTGFNGGDASCGGRTYFRFKDMGFTNMHIKTTRGRDGNTGEVEFFLGGDCELEVIIRALKFVVKVLEEESEGVID